MWGQWPKKKMLLAAATSRCRVAQDRPMGRAVRWAYALKALICLILGLKSSLWTKPKTAPLATYVNILESAAERELVINFRVSSPPLLGEDECQRVWMVHDSFIRGWNKFLSVEYRAFGEVKQERGGGYWPEGWYIVREAVWHPLPKDRLIPMTGFRGFRYRERDYR
jgi:hypothetical protein